MSYDIYAGFAKRLIQLCEQHGLPERGRQAALARICNIKPSSVNKWFNAMSLPDAANLLTIADWGKTTVDWLLDGRTQNPGGKLMLTWVSAEEEEVLSLYRQCTGPSKLLLKEMAKQVEKDKVPLRAAS